MLDLSRIRNVLLAALVGTVLVAGDCDDDPTGIAVDADFEATLTGSAERPDPVTTNATGSAFFDENNGTVSFRVEVEDIENVTLAHIHVGGVEVAGPVSVLLFDAGGSPRDCDARCVLVEDTFTVADLQAGGGLLTLEALLAAMAAGTTYVNVHTSEHPGGEVRGQITES